MANPPPFYRRPPVIERVLSVYAEMSDEVFESRFDEWGESVKHEFPFYEPLTQWLIHVRDRDKDEGQLPLFDTTQPELRITPRFSRKAAKENFDWSIRCPRGQFTMNMHSLPEQGEGRRYGTLRNAFSEWLPRWISHFDVKTFTKVTAHYVNLVSRATVPQFVTKDGRLLLGEVLTVFLNIPGEHECLVPPFDCKVTVRLQGQDDAILRLTVNDWSNDAHGPAVRVDFVVEVAIAGSAEAESVLSLLDWCHQRIVDRFEVVFTEKAKRTFEPSLNDLR